MTPLSCNTLSCSRHSRLQSSRTWLGRARTTGLDTNFRTRDCLFCSPWRPPLPPAGERPEGSPKRAGGPHNSFRFHPAIVRQRGGRVAHTIPFGFHSAIVRQRGAQYIARLCLLRDVWVDVHCRVCSGWNDARVFPLVRASIPGAVASDSASRFARAARRSLHAHPKQRRERMGHPSVEMSCFEPRN